MRSFSNTPKNLFYLLLTSLAISADVAAVTVDINGSIEGRAFEGVGAVAAGGPNRMLIDYPEPYRSDILDYLFKPKFGAGFQHLKVEIGGDNCVVETTPSIAHTRAELAAPDYTRGWMYWYLRMAKDRNPNILLDCLEWGAPGWIGNGVFKSQDNADYVAKFILGAKSAWNLDIDYVGERNESPPYDRNYLVNMLRPTLIRNGLSNVKIVSSDLWGMGGVLDDNWAVVRDMQTDTALRNTVYAVTEHYLNEWLNTTDWPKLPAPIEAQECGKPIWSSEEWSLSGEWANGLVLARVIAKFYFKGQVTKVEVWPLLGAGYTNVLYSNTGVITAHQSWSGNYTVTPSIWAVAHYTQFAEPGWKYIPSGCGGLGNFGYYSTFKKPDNSGDYSIVVANGSVAGSMTFNLSGGLSTGVVHVWKSNSTAQFIKQADITPVNSSFTISIEADALYSLTTTTGQQKGAATHPIPVPAPFPFPYTENFESYAAGKMPTHFNDHIGVFETVKRTDGNGMALRQVVNQKPITWLGVHDYAPFTKLGDPIWKDYQVSADVLIENSGFVVLSGRVNPCGLGESPQACWLKVDQTGNWSLMKRDSVRVSGKVAFSANTWHNLKMRFSGSTVTGFIDNVQVLNRADNSYSVGAVGLGSGWNNAQFDNLSIVSLDDADNTCPVSLSNASVTATSQHAGNEAVKVVDGNQETFWTAEWTPVAPLPQSLTLDLGGVIADVSKLTYLPRQDGTANGNITEYTISTSTDGTTFTQRATGTWTDDASLKRATWTAENVRSVRLTTTAGHGGFAAAAELQVYKKCPPVAVGPSEHSFRPGANNQAIFRVGLTTFNVPYSISGRMFSIALYDLTGKLLKITVVKNRSIDVRKDIGLSEGVYIARVRTVR